MVKWLLHMAKCKHSGNSREGSIPPSSENNTVIRMKWTSITIIIEFIQRLIKYSCDNAAQSALQYKAAYHLLYRKDYSLYAL